MQAGVETRAAMGPSVRSDLRPETIKTSHGRKVLWARDSAPASRPTSPLVYSRSQSGRLASYFRVLNRLFGVRRAGFRDILFSRSPVLFLMIEEAFLLYILVSLLRAATGRRTAGLLLRPLPLATSRRWHHRLKGLVLQGLKRFRSCRPLTILPFSVCPAFSKVASGWIYDFQLWDLAGDERKAVEALRGQRCPDGRLVLSAIGKQSLLKGFHLFADTYTRYPHLRARFQFISCGRVEPVVGDYAAVFCEAGGVCVDRIVSNAELLGSYAASDAVWCLYPPVGDYASGILGRAAQLGIPVIVRYGSLAHRLCIVENIQHVPANAEDVADRLAGALPPCDEHLGRTMALRFARHSEAALRTALGLCRDAAE